MIKTNLYTKLQDSAVCMATGYGLDSSGVEFRWGWDFPHPSRPTSEIQPALRTGPFPEVYLPGVAWITQHYLGPGLKKE